MRTCKMFIPAIALVAILTSSLSAQITISASQGRLGDPYTISATGGMPNSEWFMAFDTDPGPTFFPLANNLQVDLGFSSNFATLPKTYIGPAGTGAYSGLVFNNPALVGIAYYMQAFNMDPTNAYNISVSNQREAILHASHAGSGSTTALTLGDDDSQLVNLPFSFPFYGTSYTQMHVNSNGTVSFGAANTGFFVNESFFLSGPASIAGLWADFNPTLGGTVEVDQTSAPGIALIVRYSNMQHNIYGGSSSFEIHMHKDGHFVVEFGAVSIGDGVTGATPGGVTQTNALDLSLPGFEDHADPLSMYQEFDSVGGSPFDLANKLITFGKRTEGYLLYF